MRSFVRAAASSTASGRPSRRRQIASTMESGASSRPITRARSTKRAAPSPAGSGSVDTHARQTREGARLVTSTETARKPRVQCWRPGAAASAAAATASAARR